MNLLYVGSLYPESLVKELIALKSHVDFPANSLQHALMLGIDKEFPKLKVISSSPLSPYPKIKKWNFRYFKFSHKEDDDKKDAYVGVLNLPLIRLVSRFLRIRSELKKSISRNDDNVVLCYGLHTPYILAVWSLRRYWKKMCILVPDLPQFMSGKPNRLYRLAKSIDFSIIRYCIRSFDGFVLLSPYMADKLPIEGKSIQVMDGIYGGTPEGLEDVSKDGKKTILYTGDTAERCGMLDLIEAFKMIPDEDYRLWIRGYGTNIDSVLERIKTDKRIVYFPPMSRTELLRLERKATVLVNPIRPSQEFTRYYFPSKTMEYLAAGTPTVMYHLDCLSKEYDSHVHYVPEETVESLRDTLVKVCEQTPEEREKFGQAAKEFIINEKNPYVQAKKVCELIKG